MMKWDFFKSCGVLLIMLAVGNFLLEYNQYFEFSAMKIPDTVSDRSLHESQIYDIRGKKILMGIPSYDHKGFPYLERMLDNTRNLCETGAQVTVFIYTTIPYDPKVIHLLNSRTNCRSPVGELHLQIKLYPPSIRNHLVNIHRKDFYDNLMNFDLFIYSEDDHDIQPRHVISYLAETERLKQIVGAKDFPKYSIGFIRYELNENNKRVTFDQFAFPTAGLKPFTDDDDILPHPLRYKYIHNVMMPYQGMFMATREQLELWRSSCNFDRIKTVHHDESWHREYVANLQLYENFKFPEKNCHVTQVFPIDDTFEDFFIHHMSNKYFAKFSESRPEYMQKNTMDPLLFQNWRIRQMKNGDRGTFLDQNNNYKGIVTELGDVYWEQSENRPDLSRIKKYEHDGTL